MRQETRLRLAQFLALATRFGIPTVPFSTLAAMQRLAQWNDAPAMIEYTDYLTKVLENSDDAAGEKPWPTIPDGAEEKVGPLSLLACPLDLSRRRALRAVELPELTEKAKAITLAQRWRPWDVLKISRLPGTTGLEGTFVEDFHQRACALGALFYVHWLQGSTVPQFLVAMGRNIPTKYMGPATRTVALARAVQTCAPLQVGVSSTYSPKWWARASSRLAPSMPPNSRPTCCRSAPSLRGK